MKETITMKRFKDELGGVLPERPRKVSERNYNIFRDHVEKGVGYETLSSQYRGPDDQVLSRQRIHQIVEQALIWMVKDKNNIRSLVT